MSTATQDRPTTPEDVRLEPAAALRLLLESEGWSLFIAHVRTEWGAAAVTRKIKKMLAEHPAADHSALTQAILGTQEQVQALLSWPEEEAGALEQQVKDRRAHGPEIVDGFAQHRRVQA